MKNSFNFNIGCWRGINISPSFFYNNRNAKADASEKDQRLFVTDIGNRIKPLDYFYLEMRAKLSQIPGILLLKPNVNLTILTLKSSLKSNFKSSP